MIRKGHAELNVPVEALGNGRLHSVLVCKRASLTCTIALPTVRRLWHSWHCRMVQISDFSRTCSGHDT